MNRKREARSQKWQICETTVNKQSRENYAWYLDCKYSALGEINSTRVCASPIEAYWTFYFEEDNRLVAAPRGYVKDY